MDSDREDSTTALMGGRLLGHGRLIGIIRYIDWEVLAEERSDWRSALSRGDKVHEAKRILDAKTNREIRKSLANSSHHRRPSLACFPAPLQATGLVVHKLV